MSALLAWVHVAQGVIWFSALVGAASTASRWLRRSSEARTLDAVTGLILLAFGVRTALETR